MAQLDVCQSGDKELTGLIPIRSGKILSRRLIMKFFLRSFSMVILYLLLIQNEQLSVSGKKMSTSTA